MRQIVIGFILGFIFSLCFPIQAGIVDWVQRSNQMGKQETTIEILGKILSEVTAIRFKIEKIPTPIIKGAAHE